MADVDDGVVVEQGDEGSTVPPFTMPSAEELLAAIEKMGGLSDADKEQLREGVLRRQQGGSFDAPPQQPAIKGAGVEFIMLLAWIAVILLVFAFFGYKLYKSLVERQRRREEKKRLKLQKKKK